MSASEDIASATHLVAMLDREWNAAIDAAAAACEVEMRKKDVATQAAQRLGCSLCAVVVRALERPVA